MVYHDRAKSEHEELIEIILSAIRSDARRREAEAMWQSMADYVEEKGRKKGRREGRKEEALRTRQQVLVRQLRKRFGRVPQAVERVIAATTDIARLDAWLVNFVTAQTLADVGITTAPDQ
jgi:hypothetical protein